MYITSNYEFIYKGYSLKTLAIRGRDQARENSNICLWGGVGEGGQGDSRG